jgi:hypothetical protein
LLLALFFRAPAAPALGPEQGARAARLAERQYLQYRQRIGAQLARSARSQGGLKGARSQRGGGSGPKDRGGDRGRPGGLDD